MVARVIKMLEKTWLLFLFSCVFFFFFVCACKIQRLFIKHSACARYLPGTVGYKDVQDTAPILKDSTVYYEGIESTQTSPLG